MREEYLWPSLIVAAWTGLVAAIGFALDWSDGAVFAVAMVMVGVMVLVVGLRADAHDN
jgi:hypothetical protein